MKDLIKYGWCFVILVCGLLVSLDIVYTSIYYFADGGNKVDLVRHMQNQKLDFVVFGSSRVKYHMDIAEIKNKTGKIGYNLGESDQGLFEIYLMVKKFLSNNNTADKIFIQVDDNWNDNQPNTLASSYFMPYIYDSVYVKDFWNLNGDYRLYELIPFYRYMKNSPSIGFRNISKRIFQNASETDKFGFRALGGVIDDVEQKTATFKPKDDNGIIDKIIELCNKYNSEVMFFSAPTLEYQSGEFAFLESKLPNYKNFVSDAYQQDLFRDEIHLNKKGVQIFMDQFVKEYYLNYLSHR